MKMILAAPLLALALVAAPGCSSLSSIGGAQFEEVNTPEEVLAVAELSYQGALRSVEAQVSLGNVRPEQAEQLISLVDDAQDNLELARQIVEVGGDPSRALTDLNTIISALTIIVDEIDQRGGAGDE